MSAAALRHLRRAGVSLQIGGGMALARRRDDDRRTVAQGARLAIDNDRVLVDFKPHEAG